MGLRNVAVIGGLLVLISADDANKGKSALGGIVPPLQNVKVNTQMEAFTMVGRVLIGIILLSMIFKEREEIHWVVEYPALIIGTILAGLLVVGYKAKVAAFFQAVLLLLLTCYSHAWFVLSHLHWERDLQRYYFFQSLSVTGAMLLIASRGAGRFSMDGNKKFG